MARDARDARDTGDASATRPAARPALNSDPTPERPVGHATSTLACRQGRPAPAAWLTLAAVLALTALVARIAAVPVSAIDWQPARAWPEGWRAFSAVAVHYSALHLAANLAGTLGVAALGWAARLPLRSTVAWAVAWPLTQLGLAWQPELAHYGGLSGVLHAGVAVAALHVLWHAHGWHRSIGLAVLLALAAKVIGEAPWGPPLRHSDGWDIALAPLAHASGAVAGLVCAIAAEGWRRLAGGAFAHPGSLRG